MMRRMGTDMFMDCGGISFESAIVGSLDFWEKETEWRYDWSMKDEEREKQPFMFI